MNFQTAKTFMNQSQPILDLSVKQGPADQDATWENLQGGDNLLYETYDDYFNTNEEVTRPTTTNPDVDDRLSTSLQRAKPPELYIPTHTTPFFFVLSASTPLTPSNSGEILFTPISPLESRDVPEALANLLPQPANSLLEIINLVQSSPPETENSEGSASPKESNGKPDGSESLSNPVKPTILKQGPSNSTSPIQSKQLQLRETNAAVPFSRTFVNSPRLHSFSTAEVSSSPHKYQPPALAELRDPHMRLTYLSRPLPPVPKSPLGLRPRVREARSMEVPNSTPRAQNFGTRGHVRGLSSPFPLPINFSFAPASVPGSDTTPYSYF